MRRLLIVLSILTLVVLCACAAIFAAFLPQITEQFAPPTPPARPRTFVSEFPKRLIFSTEVESGAEITQASLIVQADGQSSSARYIPEFTPGKKVSLVYEYDLQKHYLPPGVTGQFWWVLKDAEGKETQTQKEAFRVDEPKIRWKKIENSRVAIYWYSGDQSFGQAIFNRANASLALLEKDTGVTADRQTQIFIYGNRDDFLNALGPNVAGWEGGRTHPDYGIVLIEASSRELNFAQAATTHEMTHVVMHAKVRSGLGELTFPHWLDEGLAMYYETVPGSLHPQFATPLKKAIQNDTLLSIRSMSARYPVDQVDLGYAESFSVVDFIYRKYGRAKMQELLLAIKTGGDFDGLARQVLGVDQDGLENEWRKDIGAPPRAARTPTPADALPTPFPTYSLSTEPLPTPTR
jgi:hypothetical protein